MDTKDNDVTPETWVDALIQSARESADKTVQGVGEIGTQVIELTGGVARIAETVGKLAKAVSDCKTHATDTKHAVTAADWFWRQVRTVLSKYKTATASVAAVMWVLSGNTTGGAMRPTADDWRTVAVDYATLASVDPTPHTLSKYLESLLRCGQPAVADRVLARHGDRLPERDRYWWRAQVREAMGDSATADVLLWKAATAGSEDAAAVIRRKCKG